MVDRFEAQCSIMIKITEKFARINIDRKMSFDEIQNFSMMIPSSRL